MTRYLNSAMVTPVNCAAPMVPEACATMTSKKPPVAPPVIVSVACSVDGVNWKTLLVAGHSEEIVHPGRQRANIGHRNVSLAFSRQRLLNQIVTTLAQAAPIKTGGCDLNRP